MAFGKILDSLTCYIINDVQDEARILSVEKVIEVFYRY